MNTLAVPSNAARQKSLTSRWTGSIRETWASACAPALARLQPLWERGCSPLLERRDDELAVGDDVHLLGAMVKAEMRARFERGELPQAAEYLARFPLLRHDRERILSVIYEEFCLREELGQPAIADEFCARYEEWADSLASQLRYHRLISQVVVSSTPPSYPHPGEVFAERFRLRSILGEGGSARVYLAEQPELGDRAVALKVSAQQGKEPSIQGRLDHAHIVPVWSVTDDPASGLRGLCMPYRPGRPLDLVIRVLDPQKKRPTTATSFLAALGPFPETQANDARGWRRFPARGSYADAVAWIGVRIARALAHAHARGILHRDVKPANVLLTYQEGPQLLDFNLAHDPNSRDQAAAALRGGTLPYMAPEQLRAFLDPKGWDAVGPQADLFSLGLILDELLTGNRPPSQPLDEVSLPRVINDLIDLRETPFPAPRQLNPRVPHALSSIVQKCRAAHPANRYQDASHLAEDLDRYLNKRPLRHASNPCRRERTINFFRRFRLQIAALLFVVCVPLAYRVLVPEPSVANVITTARDQSGRMELLLENSRRADAAAEYRAALAGYQSALRRDPDAYQAILGLAHLAFLFENDYARAVALYDRAFATMERTQVPASDSYLRAMMNRAIALVALGRERQGPKGSPPALRGARLYFQRAVKDLDELRAVLKSDPKLMLSAEDRFRASAFSARALLGLGDTSTGGFDRHREALDHYAGALAHCEAALAALGESSARSAMSPQAYEQAKKSVESIKAEIHSHASDTRADLPTAR